MASIYRPTIKLLLCSLVITAGISLSAFSTVKESQASSNSTNTGEKNESKRKTYPPKSHYEKKIQKDLSMLIPGNKLFNPRFLNFVLANRSHK
ncbi:hypothetical protein [Thalassotalea profundi]|uniref:Uncharacterized protein n=1 Tax=Thalassotalea profundi TaxID=2036687 RepID=A0ABQ3J7A0_9GAMM|nr:hypothetical protein [Thalassotalea profundi]GHF01041.1 hypothetical protein GCM10011501_33170 [Thalassotalea profundi]